jgi:hypothetical protein
VRGTSCAFVVADKLNVTQSQAMVHYNVWFSLKDGVDEAVGLRTFEAFLGGLTQQGEVSAYRLLKNSADAARTKLPRYQAIVEFIDEAALGRAMKNQVARGIHSGAHGAIVEIVSEFRVEIFRLLTSNPVETLQYACEI